MGNNKKLSIIFGGIVVVVAALLVFLTVWDPPAPSQEIKKDVTDDLFTS